MPAIGVLSHIRKPHDGEHLHGRALLNAVAGSYVLGAIPRAVFVIEHASDDVDEDRVVMTCCKMASWGSVMPGSGKTGFLSLFQTSIGSVGIGAKKADFLRSKKYPGIWRLSEEAVRCEDLAKRILEKGVSRATAYRRIDDADKAGLIKFNKGKDGYGVPAEPPLASQGSSHKTFQRKN